MRISLSRLLVSFHLLAVCGVLTQSVWGQNVSHYPAMPDPYLLLLREPAVLDDLRLTAEQRHAIDNLNAELDGPLLSSRNQPAEQQAAQVTRWIRETREKTATILQAEQSQRIEQIQIRVRGVRSLLSPSVAQRLQLTESQTNRIQAAFEGFDEEIKKLQPRATQGEPSDPRTRQASELQQQVQKGVLSSLTDQQRSQLAALIGRSFDMSQLGHTRFKAPDLIATNDWINASPTRLVDLHGKVIALHFWTYG